MQEKSQEQARVLAQQIAPVQLRPSSACLCRVFPFIVSPAHHRRQELFVSLCVGNDVIENIDAEVGPVELLLLRVESPREDVQFAAFGRLSTGVTSRGDIHRLQDQRRSDEWRGGYGQVLQQANLKQLLQTVSHICICFLQSNLADPYRSKALWYGKRLHEQDEMDVQSEHHRGVVKEEHVDVSGESPC